MFLHVDCIEFKKTHFSTETTPGLAITDDLEVL